MRVSHETIYMALYIQGRGALRQELHRALRTGCALRQPKKSVANGQGMWSVRRLDHRRHRLGRRGPLVEHWNGTSWTVIPSADPPTSSGDYLQVTGRGQPSRNNPRFSAAAVNSSRKRGAAREIRPRAR
jgi:hypothetical protein